MKGVLTEIPPLSDKDCLYIVERHKTEFNYPLHQHREFELNFIEHAAGAQRVVGDSVEEISDYELVLIGGENLEHVWKQGSCTSRDVREVTIQFPSNLFSEQLLYKNQFSSIHEMLKRAEHGLSFSLGTIMKTYTILDKIAGEQEKFEQFLTFLHLMYDLSVAEDSRVLASTSFAQVEHSMESKRITRAKQYVNDHYNENISLSELAALSNMSPSSFSRFFKQNTGRTLSDYIIDVRLGNAARMLVDTSVNVSDICYECGFNNQSNFNRIFKSKRGLTPSEFRAMFKKNKVIV